MTDACTQTTIHFFQKLKAETREKIVHFDYNITISQICILFILEQENEM